MPAEVRLKYRDHSDETSTVGFSGVALSAANFTAQVALQDALIAATDAITLGNLAQYQRVADVVEGSNAIPSNPFAQREMKWLVSYEDNVTFQRYTKEIPTPDLALLTPNTDLMDIAAGAGQAWVAAFDAYQFSPNGNSVTVLSVRLVGRNL